MAQMMKLAKMALMAFGAYALFMWLSAKYAASKAPTVPPNTGA